MDPTFITPDEITLAECRVVRVDPDKYTVDIVSDGPNTLVASSVPWLAPYRSLDGGGIDFVPEVGSTCWTIWHPWDQLPTIIGFSSQYNPKYGFGFSGWKLHPGDKIIWGRAANRIIVRNTGDIEVVAASHCKRLYLPTTRTIQDLSHNYSLSTSGGSLSFKTGDLGFGKILAKPHPQMKNSSLFELKVKKHGPDGEETVRIRAGGLYDTPETNGALTVYELEVLDKFRFALSDSGDWKVQANNETIEISGDSIKKIFGNQTEEIIAGNKTITIKKGGLKIEAPLGSVEFSGLRGIEKYKTEKHIDAPLIKFGNNPNQPAVLGVELLQWLATHVHPYPTGPPTTIATLPAILSKKILLE